MLDWLAYWGVTQAAGFIFKPILEDLAKDAAKDWAKDFLKGIPGKIFQKLKKEDIEIAAGKALKEFLQLMQQQLKVRCKLAETEIKEYTKDIKKFISDKSVAETLGKGFDINCESLDAKTLEDSWNRLQLKPLPSKFNWQSLIEQYFTEVQELLLDSKELHHLLELQKLSDIERNTQEIAGVIVDFNLVKYQEGIRERYGNLKLDSLDTSGYAYNELKLWRIFTAQNVRETHQVLPPVHELPKEHLRRLRENDQVEVVELEELERHKRVYFEQPIRCVLDVVNKKQDYKSIVILGDPGSGKSTLLQFLALNWAESPLDNVISLPIPLLIELRTYMRRREDKECNNFLEFFHKCSGVIHHLNQLELDKKLKAGNALVMFDGLDEVFDAGKREDVITDIHCFTNDYPDVQVIVTSRIIGYKPQRLLNAEFSHFILQDLDLEQIQDFIYRWHELTFTDAVDKVRKRERLKRGITASKSIAELAGNPLLLTMMAILNRNQELPRDRATLYDQASRVLLHQWDVERALTEDKRLDPKTVDYKDKQAMLRQVAYLMQTGEKGLAGNLINENDLVKVLTDYLKTIEFDKPREAARVMINQLRTRNFMLCFMGADYYAFVHRTFLEYFCAWEFVWQFKETQTLTIEQLKNEVFGKHWQDESWHEVLLLIAGMIEPRFVGEILEYLMEKDGEGEKYVNLFLAAKCLAEVRNKTSIFHISTKLNKYLKDLTKYDLNYFYQEMIDKEEAKLVREIRTKAVSAVATTWQDEADTLRWLLQRASSDESWFVRRRAVQEFAHGWKDYPDTLYWLKQCATSNMNWSTRDTAVEELAQGWKDDPDTLIILKQCATSDNDELIRQTAVKELAQGWKDDPDTLIILKQCATSDNDKNVRQTAVKELVQGWKDDPDTLIILKQCTTSDNDKNIRQTAVEELAQGWKDDPDTLIILKQRATSDNDKNVRQTAVRQLAQGWKDDPDILIILKQCAISDENPDARRTAMRQLAQEWKDDPDTLIILKQCATSDENPDARQTAVRQLAQGWKDDPDTLPWLKSLIQSDEHPNVREAGVEELAKFWKDDPDTLPWLKSLTNADNWTMRGAVMIQLVKIWKDDSDTLNIVKSFAQSDEHWAVRGEAIEHLVEGWKDNPEILPILKLCAQSDKNWGVRQQAVHHIAKGWKDNFDVLDWLKTYVQNDSDSVAEQVTVEELARDWKNHPKTLPWLKSLVLSDDDWFVRQGLMPELAKRWKYEPGMFEFFRDLAIQDNFEREADWQGNPRQTSLEVIIEHYTNHPQTLPLLRDRAKNDPDEQVREFAQKKLKQWEG